YEIVIGNTYNTGSGLVVVNTVEEIAAAFGVLINVDSAASDYTATAVDEVLSLLNSADSAFTVDASVTPAPKTSATISFLGDPVDGDIYQLTIEGVATFSVTVGN